MNYSEFREKLCSVDVSKACLRFLAERIAGDNYRGLQCSQHNRYNMDVVFTVLEELYKIAGTEKMIIRTADLKKRPVNLPEEASYAIYVDRLSQKLGRCTQDSVRKNLFVDLHRMGLLERYNTKGQKLAPYENGTKKYVRLSELGLDFIAPSHSLFERKLRYTRAIDTLTKGLADQLLVMTELGGHLSATEFQFFLSYSGETLNGHRYTISQLVEYIQEFRRLSRYQQSYAVQLVKEYCTPQSFRGTKIHKRDYHNWLNETQQIFMLMSQTAYFEQKDDGLRIRVGKGGLYESQEKLVRSQKEKAEYFRKHSVEKTKGFELHHIVPLCWAKTALEFAALDVWQNLIYIDGYKHSVITQSSNAHIRLGFSGRDITLTDVSGGQVYCAYEKNVRYAIACQETMLSCNRALLHSCGAAL